MQISHVKRMLAKGHGGTFRPLRPGELIQAADVVVYDTWYDFPSDSSIGQACDDKDRIIRLEFSAKGPRHK